MKTTRNKFIKFFDTDMLVIVATRYFIGRMTISTVFHANSLVKAWKHLPNNVKSSIKSDLKTAFEEDDLSRSNPKNKYHPLGMNIDREAWEKVRECYENDNLS